MHITSARIRTMDQVGAPHFTAWKALEHLSAWLRTNPDEVVREFIETGKVTIQMERVGAMVSMEVSEYVIDGKPLVQWEHDQKLLFSKVISSDWKRQPITEAEIRACIERVIRDQGE